MLTTLINTSIVWLCSLLVYELLLKNTTFHRLNRYYLLLTFIAGILLPLLPWDQSIAITTLKSNIDITPQVISNQVTAVAEIQLAGTETQNNNVNWRLIVYLTGLVTGMLYMLRDLWRLWSLYRSATIRREDRWIIAETGKQHGPFSILHIIFIADREQYTDQQFQMIVHHEQQHHRSRHILDLALMQLATVLLWFHPLAYVYKYKLRLLHEYEVDSRQRHDIQAYGQFLLEQAVLGPVPIMSHAFSLSPLKNRIHMMTRNTSNNRTKYRFLLLLPMLCIFILCCTQNKEKIAIDIKDRFAMRHDANLEYPQPVSANTVTVPGDSGEENFSFTLLPTPVKLDNQDVLQLKELGTAPQCTNPGSEFGIRYLLQRSDLENTLKKMLDGTYFIAVSNIIIDPSGRIAYYMITFPENQETTIGPGGFNYAKPNGLTESDKNEIQKKLSETLIGGDIAFKPIKNQQGNDVPYMLESFMGDSPFELSTTITVKNHKLSYENGVRIVFDKLGNERNRY